jgi:predicted PurR-regulated permease PerM
MNADWDPELTRVFARAREPLGDDLFTATLLQKIERVRRRRLWRQIVVAAAVVLIVALNLRLVLDETADAVRMAVDAAPTYSEWVMSPWAWVGSLIVGAWVVLRTRRSRR